MTPQQEVAFEKKAERHFKSHRELPNGRDFRWDATVFPEGDHAYRKNFDSIFPNAPGAGF